MAGTATRPRIAYVGPGLSGRTTSFRAVLSRAGVVVATHAIGNLDFNFAWRGEAMVGSIATKRAIYGGDSAPGLADETERVVAAAGYIFVIDSQVERLLAGVEQLERLRRDLATRRKNLDEVPVVFQLNKRDLPSAITKEQACAHFTSGWCKYVESIADRELGPIDAFDALHEMMRR